MLATPRKHSQRLLTINTAIQDAKDRLEDLLGDMERASLFQQDVLDELNYALEKLDFAQRELMS